MRSWSAQQGASFTIKAGGGQEQAYRIHARSECVLCHNPWVEKKTTAFGIQSASPLGVNTLQMNKRLTGSVRKGNQLTLLSDDGILGWTPEPAKLPRLVDPYDESADLEARARSYLQTNCAHCHQFNAGGSATIALGFEVPLAGTQTVGFRPIQGTFGISGARIIAPGDPAGSVLYYRMSKLGGGRMPRVGSNQVDERATRMIHDWIARMPASADAREAAAEASRPRIAMRSSRCERRRQLAGAASGGSEPALRNDPRRLDAAGLDRSKRDAAAA